jgi:superfamily II DNA or RNA helicase
VSFAVGSLVKARGREWVVLPDSSDELLVVRPLGGTDDEIAGILPTLERIDAATFDLPDPNDVGDARSARLLRDALRLTFRSSAGPFRSFGRIAVEPRPYQLVPLLMALKLDPVRLLIADDVGIGKTVEALLVAREMLDQGDAQRLAVLCPPHLAEQWQAEMRDKFHLDAELVLSGTAARLERDLRIGESVFERYPLTIVSTDYIKSDRHREDFLRAAPELVIVDEAHTCTDASAGRGGRHQRYRLVSGLARDPDRHLVLVTATPHSGKEDAFRALVGFLDESFRDLPDDLSTEERARERRRLAQHMVQRRRADIEHYLGDTPFPKREVREETYALTPEYRALFEKMLAYARETVADPDNQAGHRQRVRWWAILGLLRALASSPAAAAATLRNRARSADTVTAEEADELGRRDVLDLVDDESAEGVDVVPGADAEEGEDPELPTRRRLNALAREADALTGAGDPKLTKGVDLIRQLVKDGYSPIVFCRFIPTAHYVADALRAKLKGVTVEAVTGELPPAEREQRVLELGEAGKRVLVATDCLSEGINLQEHFDAVVHYDLSWNPTRHEQRDGRVDRYGQKRDPIRVLTYFGSDNRIDGIVLDVLLRKHNAIRDSLGISVPVPVDSNAVLEAIMEGLILRGRDEQLSLLDAPDLVSERDEFHHEWDLAADREKRSRTVFAQETIKTDEVRRELDASRAAIGSADVVQRFVVDALRAERAVISGGDPIAIDLSDTSRALRDQLRVADGTSLRATFELPAPDGVTYLSRTHPLVEGLAGYVVDTALDPQLEGVAKRAGAMRTKAVETRTTILLVRIRFDVVTTRRDEEDHRQIAEESLVLAFRGAPDDAAWLPDDEAAALLDATPDGNVSAEQARDLAGRVVEGAGELRAHLDEIAGQRADALLDTHRRVRESAHIRGVGYSVEAQLPVDVLGVYVLLPAPTL